MVMSLMFHSRSQRKAIVFWAIVYEAILKKMSSNGHVYHSVTLRFYLSPFSTETEIVFYDDQNNEEGDIISVRYLQSE